MDIATIIGLVLAAALIVGSILMGGSLSAFINVPGLAIVLGGTIAATLVMQRLAVVLGAVKVALNVIFDKGTPPEDVIKIIVDMAGTVRKDGLLALEKVKVDDSFLQKGVRMLVDGLSQDDVKSVLRTELVYLKLRHKRGQKVFKFMTATAPAMGMVGTLIGLVQMLQTLSDPSAIGPAMAVALLTTFYGAVLAFVVFGPIAAKLENRTSEESIRLEMIISGVIGIMNGDNPRVIEQRLVSFLEPKTRDAVAKQGSGNKGAVKKAA
ncbi:MAG: MotA/TolQ/ExbB proton channel family protein [Deltaproteobacteria bacterium]|nr:MotA/TolQ/ExbB proton channel family protein [Deltaproteobacteria bacterium]